MFYYLSIGLFIALFIAIMIIIVQSSSLKQYKIEENKKRINEESIKHLEEITKTCKLLSDEKWEAFQKQHKSDFDYLLIVAHSKNRMNIDCIYNLVDSAKNIEIEHRLYTWLRMNLRRYIYEISGNINLYNLLYIEDKPILDC